jgi:DNA-binding NarL/FixJ family response regulator
MTTEDLEAADVRTRSVLLADDTADVRILMRSLLELGGHFTVVAEASNGEEAIEKAEVHRPDLVLLDLAMPVMDGLEALPEILRRSPDSKIAVMSGFARDRLADQALQLGAHGYIEKGIPTRVLVERLIAMLDGDVDAA